MLIFEMLVGQVQPLQIELNFKDQTGPNYTGLYICQDSPTRFRDSSSDYITRTRA